MKTTLKNLKGVKGNKHSREYITRNRKKEYRQQKTVIKKQKPQKHKIVVYELESDSEIENIEQDTPESEVREIQEKQEKNDQPFNT